MKAIAGMYFPEFRAWFDNLVDTGACTLAGGKLNEFEHAIHFSVMCLYEDAKAEGRETVFTEDEIAEGVRTYCGEEIYNRVFSEGYEHGE